jgi:hypothetical protein
MNPGIQFRKHVPQSPKVELNDYVGLPRREVFASGSRTGALTGCLGSDDDTGGRDRDGGETNRRNIRKSVQQDNLGDDIADRSKFS